MNALDQFETELEERKKISPRLEKIRAMLADKSLLTNIVSDNGRNALQEIDRSLAVLKQCDKPEYRKLAHKVIAENKLRKVFEPFPKLCVAQAAYRRCAEAYLTLVDQRPGELQAVKRKIENLTPQSIHSAATNAVVADIWGKVESLVVSEGNIDAFPVELANRQKEFERQLEIARRSVPLEPGPKPSPVSREPEPLVEDSFNP